MRDLRLTGGPVGELANLMGSWQDDLKNQEQEGRRMTRNARITALRFVGTVMLTSLGLAPLAALGAVADRPELIEFEKMTWVEVQTALAAGRTTALIYTGGVEERGPQNVNGGHNLMAHATVEAIARRLGNAIFMPVLPFTPNEANPRLPGTIGLTNDLLEAILTRIAEQTIVNGFRNVVVMGDHEAANPGSTRRSRMR